jgi:hypothetical protein
MSEHARSSYHEYMPYYVRKMLESAATADAPSPRSTLRTRFVDWYASLPEFTRTRPYLMSELSAPLKTQGRHLSPILFAEGWTRKRIWSATGQYQRYWQPPP